LTEEELQSQARTSRARLENNYGTTMGTATMQNTAYKAAAASVTAYGTSKEERAQLVEDAGAQVRRGNMNASDAMAAIKANKTRPDLAGWSFGTGMGAIQAAADNPNQAVAVVTAPDGTVATGPGGTPITTLTRSGTATVDKLMSTALDGFIPGSAVGMRSEAAEALAQGLMERLNTTLAKAGGNMDDDEVVDVMAQIAGTRDVINSEAPNVAKSFRDMLNSQTITGTRTRPDPAGGPAVAHNTPVSVRDREEELRTDRNRRFLDQRKEWDTRAGTLPGPPGTFPGIPPAAPGGGPPGAPPGAPGAPGSPPSDARLKHHIVALQATSTGIQLYRFRYLWSDQEYVGVMAQDLVDTHPEALSTDDLGYYRVDYGKLGLRMMTIQEWESIQAKTPVNKV